MPASRRRSYAELRSARWYGASDLRSFGHRSRTKQMGFAAEDYAGKPVIAILNTWSEMNPCHQHFRTRAEEVKRGVWQAGGFPVEMPAMALGEPFMKPSTMMYRNLLAMEAEELLRANPIDGVVLMGGCDKTVPALVMGATSMNLPAIFLPAGPMLRGHWHGKQLGSGSDVWKYWAELRAGNIDAQAWGEIEDGIARSAGTCMTMGTASTMAAVTEALGLSLPGASSIPASDSSHARMATASGRRIVEMVWQDETPRGIMTEAAFDNAITTLMAIGGSTNGIIHLVAMAGRAGIKLPLERFDQISRKTPLLANVRPSGQYLMEDFFYAGALPALLRQLGPLLDSAAMTVNGKSLGDNIQRAEIFNDDVIRSPNRALQPEGGLAVLKGNLAPNGAVIKPSAMEQRLLKHRGPAVVFRDYNDLNRRIDDPALEVTADSVLVLQNAGPQGGPGMP
ncbi:MAG TPA: dihydroxy-acid dehydratase, partial [Stellaceae bacterium]|nr:dihydroxy-acid dehydratase [Stellaceae bacterium]